MKRRATSTLKFIGYKTYMGFPMLILMSMKPSCFFFFFFPASILSPHSSYGITGVLADIFQTRPFPQVEALFL